MHTTPISHRIGPARYWLNARHEEAKAYLPEMGKTKMNIEAYLSEDQKREIAIEEWRNMCREACDGNAERILSNIGHEVATQMVVEALGDGANELIRDKAVDVIGKMSEFMVFRRPDAWDRGPTPAFTVLMDAVKNNRELVDKKVREAIHQLTKRDAIEILKSGVIQISPAPKAVL